MERRVSLESFANSKVGIGTALGISRAMPPSVARPFVRFVTRRLTADPSRSLVRSSRLNQWMVSGRSLAGEALDEAVRENLEMAGRFLYDLYHMRDGSGAILQRVHADETFQRLARDDYGRGCIYAACHTGNFDLVGQALGHAGLSAQVLSVADPNGGYRMQNEQRERAGFEVTPVSIQSLKRATRRLEEGGVVITGLDRPLPEAPPDARPFFFGERAALPLMHVRLAMRTGASIIVIAPLLRLDGLYAIRASGHIEMEGADQLANAERVLAVAEEFIGAAPSQWIMPHDVWPGTCVPGY